MTEYEWITVDSIARQVFHHREPEQWDAEPGTVDGEVNLRLMEPVRESLEGHARLGLVERHPSEPDTYRATDVQTLSPGALLSVPSGDHRRVARRNDANPPDTD